VRRQKSASSLNQTPALPPALEPELLRRAGRPPAAQRFFPLLHHLIVPPLLMLPQIDRPAVPTAPAGNRPSPARAPSVSASTGGNSVPWEGRIPPRWPHIAAASRRTRTPVKASTQRGGSPRQADRSPAWNRRLLRRGHTGWEVAGGERPVRNHVPCLTGHTVNPIRPRRPASLPVLCQRAPMQNVFCMGTQARAMTHVGSCPSACGQGSLACGPLQRKA